MLRRPDDATLLSNRSAARLLLGQHEAALEDAVAAVRLRPTWGKAYSRQGAALAALERVEEAMAALRAGLERDAEQLARADRSSSSRAVPRRRPLPQQQ